MNQPVRSTTWKAGEVEKVQTSAPLAARVGVMAWLATTSAAMKLSVDEWYGVV